MRLSMTTSPTTYPCLPRFQASQPPLFIPISP
uniref:Uncharacterized protein n=1 Tax=Triticum urartu TaxID=4572 RepID=A0A8R7V7L8_TRIUA